MKRGATRLKEFDYSARSREKPALGNAAYAKLWTIVDGGVRDALKAHPDYLTPKGQHSARTSIVKRVTGTVIGFAEQSAKGRGNPAETEEHLATGDLPAPAVLFVEAGAGVSSSSPINPHCRIGKVVLKSDVRAEARRVLFGERRTHKQAKTETTARLRRFVAQQDANYDAIERALFA